MTLAKIVATSLAQKHGLHEAVGSLVDTSLYRMIVGSLQYLTLTRPDITHAVNLASQFMQSPNIEHLQRVKMILRYIKGTLHFGLRIISQSPYRLYGYSNADWRGCTTSRRSTIGYSIYLCANCISWTSKKQTTVPRSSVEAEYKALAFTAAEMTWITYLLHDLGVYLKSVPTLYCDNLSALYMKVNLVMHARTKHIEMDYHFVREKMARGQFLT
ncbi:secreted RxLR effector protein 161-like [Solanum dulcamara]|uniref:secreted RxLR effector protein 161-like n=1 Tax=Solanum dulcamara TaxID=45834 RepID=UPI0024855D57|nr:secreted RxLR effector protein 161-like [Solanum dulcamara]